MNVKQCQPKSAPNVKTIPPKKRGSKDPQAHFRKVAFPFPPKRYCSKQKSIIPNATPASATIAAIIPKPLQKYIDSIKKGPRSF